MKKGISLLLALVMVFSLASCGKNYKYVTYTPENEFETATDEDGSIVSSDFDGSPNAVLIDPFDGLKVSFDGISPYCTIAINNLKCSEAVQNNVQYSVSPDELTTAGKFAIGDKVTVYASIIENKSSYSDSTEPDKKYKLSVTEKTFTVENVPKYITELTADMDLTQLKSELADKLSAVTAWKEKESINGDDGRNWNYYQSHSDLKLNSCYMSSLKANNFRRFKDEYNFNTFNRVDALYSVKIKNTDGKDNILYFTIYATNFVQYPDGKIGWGTDNPETLDFKNVNSWVSLEDLKNQQITSKKDDFNVTEVTELLK